MVVIENLVVDVVRRVEPKVDQMIAKSGTALLRGIDRIVVVDAQPKATRAEKRVTVHLRIVSGHHARSSVIGQGAHACSKTSQRTS
jgi:hypothetical protein